MVMFGCPGDSSGEIIYRRLIWVDSRLRKRELKLSNLEWTMEVVIVKGSLKVKHASNAVKVTNIHEAGTREVGDVIREGEMWIKSNTKIADRGVRGEGKR